MDRPVPFATTRTRRGSISGARTHNDFLYEPEGSCGPSVNRCLSSSSCSLLPFIVPLLLGQAGSRWLYWCNSYLLKSKLFPGVPRNSPQSSQHSHHQNLLAVLHSYGVKNRALLKSSYCVEWGCGYRNAAISLLSPAPSRNTLPRIKVFLSLLLRSIWIWISSYR